MATPFAGKQAPGFYRFKVGAYEVTVLSDGILTLDAAMFVGDAAGAEKLLKDAHLPTTNIPTPLNTWLINTGKLSQWHSFTEPYLQFSGVNRLDELVLCETYPHLESILEVVNSEFQVARIVWSSRAAVPSELRASRPACSVGPPAWKR